MNTRTYLIALLLLLLAVGVVGCIRGAAGGTPAFIDPALLEALEEVDEVRVLVSLRTLDSPVSEWDLEDLAEHHRLSAVVRANVISVLNEDDMRDIRESSAAAISGYITKSGVEKLRTHPDVVDIGMIGLGEYSCALCVEPSATPD